MTSSDASSTWILFERQVFPYLCNLTKQNPVSSREFMGVVYNFCAEDAEVHKAVIGRLKELVPDQQVS
jgi:hypothetical protein